jgi:hypothetical protein
VATEYSEVTPKDRDVAAFVAARPWELNLWKLPAKMWVARENNENTKCNEIIAVLMLNTHPYLAIDLIVANKPARPFMRIMRLYLMAEDWLKMINAPIVCIAIRDTDAHFQSIVRRLGFVKEGIEVDKNGNQIETVFAKRLRYTEQAPLAAETVH